MSGLLTAAAAPTAEAETDADPGRRGNGRRERRGWIGAEYRSGSAPRCGQPGGRMAARQQAATRSSRGAPAHRPIRRRPGEGGRLGEGGPPRTTGRKRDRPSATLSGGPQSALGVDDAARAAYGPRGRFRAGARRVEAEGGEKEGEGRGRVHPGACPGSRAGSAVGAPVQPAAKKGSAEGVPVRTTGASRPGYTRPLGG